MPEVVNKSPRLITVGTTRLVPTIPTEVSDEFMANPDVKRMIEYGDLSTDPLKEPNKPASPKPAPMPKT